MKIDVEDILCKAEAISLQMAQCKVYRVANDCNFFSLFLSAKEGFSYKENGQQSADGGQTQGFCLVSYNKFTSLN